MLGPLTTLGTDSYTLDNTAPLVALARAGGDTGTPVGAFDVTVTFTEANGLQTTGDGAFTADDLEVTNGDPALAATSDPLVWTVTVTPAADVMGAVVVKIPAGAVRDVAGNPNAAAELSVNADAAAPAVLSIERHDGARAQAEVTNAGTLSFRVTFGEPVTNVDTGDFAVTGATTATVNGASGVAGNAAQVIVTLGGGDLDEFDGVVGLAFAVDQDIADEAGNALVDTAPSGANESYTLDNTRPTITLGRADGLDTTLPGAFDVTVTFAEANGLQTTGAGGFVADDLEVTNGAATIEATVDALVWTAKVTPDADFQGDVRVDLPADRVQDAAGNGNEAAAPLTVPVDTDAPTVTVSGPDNHDGAAAFDVTVEFSEPVTGFEDAADLDIGGGSLTAGAGSITAAGSDGARYTVNVTPSGRVDVTVQVVAGAATDGVNESLVSETATIDYVDSTAPAVASVQRSSPAAALTNADSLSWTVTFSEPVTVGAGAFGLSPAQSGATVTATPAASAPDESWTVQASGGTALAGHEGALALSLADATLITDAAGNALTSGLPTNAEGFTLDNSAPTPALAGPSLHHGVGTFEVTVTFDEPVEDFVVADIGVTEGTTSNFSGAGGDSRYTVTVTPGGNANVTVSVSADAAADAAGNKSAAADDLIVPYRPPPSLTVEDAEAPEGEDLSFTVRLINGPVPEAFSVTIGYEDGTATAPADYAAAARVLNFAGADDEFHEFTVATVDDDLAEDDETFTITLTASDAFLDDVDKATATITDNDTAGVTVSKEGVSMTEGGSDTYTLALTSEPTADVTITVTRAAGGDADLTATPASLVFTASTWSASQAVTIAAAEDDDDFAEDAATFTHSASSDDANYGAGLAIASVAATATDNDERDTTAPTITSVERSSPSAELTNADSLSWTVTFSEAVTVGAGAFGLSPAQSGATVTATATDASPDESWTVQASGGTALAGHQGALALSLADRSKITDAAGNALTGDLPANAEGFTLDNTAPTPALAGPSLHHGVGTFEVTVTFLEPVKDFVVGDIGVTGGTTSNFSGADGSYAVTVTPGGNATVTVSVSADAATDAAGNQSLAADDLTVPYGPPPSLTVEDAEAQEGEALAFTVTLDHATESAFEVTVTLTDGTARAPADYDATPHTLAFAGTANESHTFTVPTTEDRLSERTKSFDVSLSTDDASVDASDTAVGRIKDDDHQELVIADATAQEGEDLSFTVTLINGSVPDAFSVTIGYEDGTAAGGTDYTATAHVLNFAGNDDESHAFTVATTEDTLVEGDETFTVTLAASDTFLDAADEATATITDDDAAAFTLTVEPDAIAEAGGESTVTVSTGGVTFAEAQTFTLVLTGTAVKDTDYTIGSESLALAVGDSLVETTVTSRDDNIDDDAETVVVEARLDGEAVGTAQTITLSDDDEAGVTVSKESVSMTEGGSDTYTLALTSEPTADVTITVTRAQGGDADLTATPASLVFTASTWSAAQAVTIAAAEDDDDFAEDAATFTHSASSDDANYGAGLAIASVAATATDNDTPDTTAPTITAVARSSPAAALTNADSLSWTVTFSEAVTVGAGAFGLSPAQSGATVTATATDASPDDSWTVQASGGTALAGHQGALALSLADATLITDAAGNALTSDLPTIAEGFTLDNTAPTVVSVERHDGTSAFDALTAADSLKFRVTFSEDVENVTAADFDASGAGDASGVEPVTGNAAQYIVTVSGGNLAGFDGTVGVVLALAGDIADAAGNAADTTLPSGEAYETYTLDSTAPTILRVERHNGTTAFAEVTDSDRLRFRVTFSEAVTNVDQSDFASTGASGASTVVRSTDDAAEWIVALREGDLIDHNGVVGLILTGAQDIEDLVGHALNAALPAGTNYETYTVDNAPTVVSVTRDDGNGNDPGETTSADTLRFRVTFNESVVNVSTTDFVARGGANLALTVERAVSGSGASWLVTFSGGDITDRNGIVRLDFHFVHDIEDAGGKALDATLPTGTNYETYTLSNVAPTVVSVERVDGEGNDPGEVTNADEIGFRITFSEQVENVNPADFDAGGPTGETIAVDPFRTVASQFTVTVSGGDVAGYDGVVGLQFTDRLNIQNALGVALDAGTLTSGTYETYTLDNTAPTVVSVERHDGTSAFDALTAADSLKFRVTFSEDVENVTAADFDASGAGDASGVEPVTGNAAQYIVTVSGGNLAGFDGTVGVVLALAGDIADAAGNAADTTLPSGEAYETYTLDSTAPTILRVERHNGTTAFAEVTDSDRLRFRVTFSEAVTNVDQSDFASSGASGASTVVRSTDDAAVWIVALREGALIDHNGVVGLILTGAQDIEDLVGHALNAALPAGTNYETYTVDNAPSVVSVTRDDGNGNDPGETTSADTLRFRVTFNESVVNVSTTDFVARGGANLALTVERAVSGSGASWLVTFSGGDITDRNGIVRLDFHFVHDIEDAGGKALDATLPTGTNYETYTLSNVAPTVVSVERVDGEGNDPGEVTNADEIGFRITFSEQVENVNPADFDAGGPTGETIAVDPFRTVASQFTVTVSGGDVAGYDGVVGLQFTDRLNIQNALGVALDAGTLTSGTYETYTLDNTGPTVALARADGLDTTLAGMFDVTVTFTEANGLQTTGTGAFTTDDLQVSNGSVASLSGGPLVWTAAVTPAEDFAGDVQVDLPADKVQDALGNGNAAAPPLTVPVDTSVPTVTVAGPATHDGSTAFDVQVVFSEAVTGFEDVADMDIGGGSLAGGATGITGGGNGTDYTVSITPSGMAEVTVRVVAGAASDGVNQNQASETETVAYADSGMPSVLSVERSSPTTALTNADTLAWTVTFSEDVTVSAGAFGLAPALSGATVTSTAASTAPDDSWQVEVSGGSALAGHDGAVSLSLVNASLITDAAGNTLAGDLPSSAQAFTLDNTAPTVVLARADGLDTTLAGMFDVTVTFTEANGLQTTGAGAFTTDDLDVTNGSVTSLSGGPLEWTATVAPETDFEGDVQVDLPGSGVLDAAGNANTAAPPLTVPVDTAAPTVTVSGPPTHDGSTAFDVQVIFSEAVTGFEDAADMDIGGGSLAGGATGITGGGNGTDYTVSVTPSGMAKVTVRVVAGAASDGVNQNQASETETVAYADSGMPSVLSVERSNPTAELTNADTLAWTVTFSEDVTVSAGAFGLAPALSGATVTWTAASTAPDDSWTVQATGGALTGHDGAVSLSLVNASLITNAAGNTLAGDLPSSAQAFMLDNTGPTVALARADGLDTTLAGTFDVTVTFTEANGLQTTGAGAFTTDDLQVTNGSVTSLSGGPLEWTATVAPETDFEGDVQVDLPVDKVRDAAGNANAAAVPLTVPVDTAAPTVAVAGPPSHDGSTAFNVQVIFSEAVTGFEDAADMDIGGGSLAVGATGITGGGNGTDYTVSITPSGMAEVTVRVVAGAASDGVNQSQASETVTVDYADSGMPSVLSVERSSPTTALTNADTLAWTVTFSEDVTVSAGAFGLAPALSGATVTWTAASTAPDDSWTVQATGGALTGHDGAVSLSLANASQITDAAGNTLADALPSNAEAFTLDNTGPTVALARADGLDTTLAGTFDVTVTFTEANGLQTTGVGAFTADDLDVSNGSVTSLSGGPLVWTATVAPDTDFEGDVQVDLPADKVRDALGNGNEAAQPLAVPVNTVPIAAQLGLPEGESPGTPFRHAGMVFWLDLVFDPAPWWRLGYQDVRDRLFDVTGGRILRAQRARPLEQGGNNAEWRVQVLPAGFDDVTLTLRATEDCEEEGAVCTTEGLRLETGLSVTVPGPGEPLAAKLTRFNSRHGGEPFEPELWFNHEPDLADGNALISLFQVTGGSITRAQRQEPGSNRLWYLTVEPAGVGDLTIVLPPTQDCADAGAVCTSDGIMLATGIHVTIEGPKAFSVSDAEAAEGPDAVLAFEVSLSQSRSVEVRVDASTRDGTAIAGADYEAVSQTLVFAPRETRKTVNVRVLDDAHDEGSETMTLVLSNASGARIADGEGTGTILNSDPIPKAWQARFGRTVTGQVLDAVEERLAAPRQASVRATLAGQTLPLWDDKPAGDVAAAERAALRMLGTHAAVAEATGAPAAWNAADGPLHLEERMFRGEDVAAGTAFTFSALAGAGNDAYVSLWGRGMVSGFDGNADGLTLDGRVTTSLLGVDWATERWLAGLSFGHSAGRGGYQRGDCGAEAGACGGSIAATLTGLYPYAGFNLSERLTLWLAAGLGTGKLTLHPHGVGALATDLALGMGAVGLRSQELSAAGAAGVRLTLKGDARFTRTWSEALSGPHGNLASADADVWLLRAAIEGSRSFRLGSTGSLTPSLELGVRRDGGDAEAGFGAEVGIGLAFDDARHGLRLELDLQTLTAHESADFREWGASAALSFDPRPATERGLSMSLRQSWGVPPTGGVDALLRRDTLAGLTAPGAAGGTTAGRLAGEVGYGVPVFGGVLTGTPNAGIGVSDGTRDYRVGWRITPSATGAARFEINLDATRREGSLSSAAEHGVLLHGRMNW